VANPTPIDWDKPHLRLVYLIEGQFRTRGRALQIIRWCGPKSRTGSGLAARSSTAGGGFQRAFEPGLQQYEARLSRCTFDKTLGSLKQNLQVVSEITFKVDIGEEDISEDIGGWDASSLRDQVLYGHWRGQLARFIVADLDNLDSFEVMGEGTWDKDPTDITEYSFKMTIDVGAAIPPTLPWPMWQVPEEVPDNWDVTALLSTWASGPGGLSIGDNRRAPLTYLLNDEQKGRYVGQVFGGGPGFGNEGGDVWRELAHYGEDKVGSSLSSYEYHYCLISPEFDQFCFNIAFEADDGEIYLATAQYTPYIFVWNNTNERFGPIGTVCKFAATNTMDGATKKIWGKIAGGPGFLGHGPNYTGYISYQGYDGTQLGQTTSSADAAPDVYGTNIYGAPDTIFKWIIEEVCDADLHPQAIGELLHFGANVLPQVNVWNRACAVPTEIKSDPLSVSKVLQDLMKTIPADLILKRDDTDPMFRRKYFAVPRPQLGVHPIADFSEEDLVETTPAMAGVKQLADPDGVYANEFTITTDDYFLAPDWAEDLPPVTEKRLLELVDTTEQSSVVTGQVIQGEIEFKLWNWATNRGFRTICGLLYRGRSRAQPVLEAKHGYPSFKYELGDVIEYHIDGVYHGPGQIRSLRLDLDSQTVTMRSYHMPNLPRAFSDDPDELDINIKAEVAAKGEKPIIDRIAWAKVMPD